MCLFLNGYSKVNEISFIYNYVPIYIICVIVSIAVSFRREKSAIRIFTPQQPQSRSSAHF